MAKHRRCSPDCAHPPEYQKWCGLFMDKVEVDPVSGCWLWTGEVHANGYGYTRAGAFRSTAHRFSHLIHIGPIPDGYVVDHVCHNESDCLGGSSCLHRRCVNPAHIEATTQRTNLGRSARTLNAVNAAKTECARGHPFEGDNVAIAVTGQRVCRVCSRGNTRRSRAKRRAVRA